MADQRLLSPLVEGWTNKISLAVEWRKKQYDDMAEECRKFVNGCYGDWLYKARGANDPHSDLDFEPRDGEADPGPPTFRVTINKAAELRDLFGPTLYQRNPDRRVKARKPYMPPPEYLGTDPADPMAAQTYMMFKQTSEAEAFKKVVVAEMMENVLNSTPAELGLQTEGRFWVNEALTEGLGVMWHEVVVHPSGLKSVGSFHEPTRTLVIDHDVQRWEQAQWMCRECVHPVWEVEREYGYEAGSLKGNMESAGGMAEWKGHPMYEHYRQQGYTNDLMRYWKVWSKMGMGGRLLHVKGKTRPEYADVLEQLGDFCYLVIAPGYDYPLNIPPWVLDQEAVQPGGIQKAVQWPIPFWLDKGGWPCSLLAFHRDSDRLWPLPHLGPAMGELKFINWVYSLLLSKIRVYSRDILVMLKGLAEDAKNAIKHGPDLTVIEIEQMNQSIDAIVKFIQHPDFHPQIYVILDRMMELFDKRTGLTELLYGQSGVQFRSAEESAVKQENATVRPADMAQQVEDASSELARKEMAAWRWVSTAEDMKPILGTVGAFLWEQEVLSIPPAQLFHLFTCSVEAGSTRRPNREKDVENLNMAMNNLSPLFWQYAQASMDFGPINALIGDWTKSIGMDGSKYVMKGPPPMPPMPPMTPGAAPGGPPAPGGGNPPPGPPPASPAPPAGAPV